MSGTFRVNLETLTEAIRRMEAFDLKVEEWLEQVDQQVARLHLSWSGLAASAQRADHEQWVRSKEEMREALARLRTAADVARVNYSGAVETNQTMWP